MTITGINKREFKKALVSEVGGCTRSRPLLHGRVCVMDAVMASQAGGGQ